MKKIFFSFLVFSPLFASEMSVEDKVAQTLMVHFNGSEVNDEAKALVKDLKVGGVIYYTWANTLSSKEQVKKLSEDLQKMAETPLLIAIDQEGGAVTRLGENFTQFPGNGALGKCGDPKLAKTVARFMGEELLDVGINMNLAPSVDVRGKVHSIIGIRSFASNPEDVIFFGSSTLDGFHEAGVLTTLKHFPGLGSGALDTHDHMLVLDKSEKELAAIELLPFRKLCKASDAVMTGHVLIPQIDEVHVATTSHKILDGILRKKMGFEGALISDSLVMEGFLRNCKSLEDGAIAAFNAGCDILLLGGKQLNGNQSHELKSEDVKKIHRALVEAVRSGKITKERLEEAHTRISKLKEKINKTPPTFILEEHKKLSDALSKQAVSVAKKGNLRKCVGKKIGMWTPECLKESASKIAVETVPLEEAEAFLVLSSNAWRDPAQSEKIKEFFKQGKPVVMICCNDPDDAALFPESEMIFTTWSPTLPSIQATIDLILGEIKPMAKQESPIVIIETTQGSFEVALYPDKAPKTCENFLGLVSKSYYEGTIFHRVIKEFMIQGGDPTGTGTGGESIWGKRFNDEFHPTLKFDRPGLLAMANAGPNTNGSQFFITTAETPWLNNKHTIFGEIVKGYDVIEKIEKTKTDGRDKPLEPQKIKKIAVKGVK